MWREICMLFIWTTNLKISYLYSVDFQLTSLGQRIKVSTSDLRRKAFEPCEDKTKVRKAVY